MESLYGGAQCVYRTWKRITPRLVLVEPTWGILCLNQLHTCCIRREDQHQDVLIKESVAEKIKIKMKRQWRVAAMQRPTQGWEDAEKISWKKVAHRPIVILTLYCVRRLHMQLKQVDVFLERSEAKGLEERVFYLLFLLLVVCYLPGWTCRARRRRSASASRPPWPDGWPRNSTPARVTSLQ